MRQKDENKRIVDIEDIKALIVCEGKGERKYGLNKENEDRASQGLMVRLFL